MVSHGPFVLAQQFLGQIAFRSVPDKRCWFWHFFKYCFVLESLVYQVIVYERTVDAQLVRLVVFVVEDHVWKQLLDFVYCFGSMLVLTVCLFLMSKPYSFKELLPRVVEVNSNVFVPQFFRQP